MAKVINLVLAGGGVKGIALVGAAEVLEEAGYQFARIAGTSAGAIVGGLLAAGYTSQELAVMMPAVPYDMFRDEGLLDKLGLPGKAASLLFEKGIYEGDFLYRWYGQMLAVKNVSTFGDLKLPGDYPDGHGYKLVAVAANISRGKLIHFPRDFSAAHNDRDALSVAAAIRASASLPFFFEPVMLGREYLVDGGVLSNFPFDTFRGDPVPTIGIKLSPRSGATDRPHEITGPVSYASAVITTMLSAQDQIHQNDPAVVERTIFIDTGEVMATDFDISPQQQLQLYEAGRRAAKKYLSRLAASPLTYRYKGEEPRAE